jgi:hypothetical protein
MSNDTSTRVGRIVEPLVRINREIGEAAYRSMACTLGIRTIGECPESSEAVLQSLFRPMLGAEEANRTFLKIRYLVGPAAQQTIDHLNADAIIGLWASLETGVRDAMLEWLRLQPDARARDEVAKVKVPLAQFDAMSEDERLQYVLDQLEKNTTATLKAGVGRFESVLKIIGLGGDVDDETRRTLLELSALRNVIAHRGGVIDQKFLTTCPFATRQLNERVRITELEKLAFVGAVVTYTLLIIERVRQRAMESSTSLGGEGQ